MEKLNLKNINFQTLKQKSKDIKNHKWCLIIAGIVLIIIGFYSLFHTDKTILSLVMFIGSGFVVAGIAHLFTYHLYKNDSAGHPLWFLYQGVFEIVLGFIIISNLGVTALSIPLMVAFWALFDGVIRITSAYRLKKAGIGNSHILLLTGIISLLFAALLLARPWATVVAATITIGLALIAWGITVVAEALNLYD